MAGQPLKRNLRHDLDAATLECWPDDLTKTHLDYIAARHSTGERLTQLAAAFGVSYRTLHDHLTATFGVDLTRQTLANAREQAADLYAEEQIDISDAATIHNAPVARLQIESRRWLAGKWAPKTYGNAPSVQINVDVLMLDALRQPAPLRVTATVIADDDTSLIEDTSTTCVND